METQIKKRSGRPKKAEADKVQYQRIAVYVKDYSRLVEELNKRGEKLTDAFAKMVRNYCRSGRMSNGTGS
jgi:hypothetical protein